MTPKLIQPPFPKYYNKKVKCEYYKGTVGHCIDHCYGFKKQVNNMIQNWWLSSEDKNSEYNTIIRGLGTVEQNNLSIRDLNVTWID